jgi:hypothetical protein
MMSLPAYSMADIERLLSVCRRELGTADIVDDKRLDDLQWQGLLAAACDHGLIGPLHRTAPKTYSIPDHILGSIRTAYLVQAARNFQLATALTEIIEGFTESSIEVVVLKGPAVALMAYGQICNREFTDLDLLVPPADLTRARLVLDSLGYRLVSEDVLNHSDQKDIQLVREVDDTLVELHWALNPPLNRFPLEATGIWDRLETLDLLGTPIRTLNVEDTLIALCIHASKHRWSLLKWSFDIAQILTRKADALDWDVLLQRCRTVGCTRTLCFGIQLASLLFAVTLPAGLTTPLSRNTSLMRLVEVVRDSLLQSTPLKESDLMRCHIELHDRFWDRLLIATLPFPDLPRLLPAAVSPIASGPLRFITRPVRLLHVYGLKWIRTTLVGR